MIHDVSPRVFSGLVWHQTRPRNALLDFADPARYEARYSRVGEPGVWYASLTERAAWAELFRHWAGDEISPFEVRRRVGRARVVDLEVLDLTDRNVRQRVGVTEDQLVARLGTVSGPGSPGPSGGLRGPPRTIGRAWRRDDGGRLRVGHAEGGC